jgi:hypothetical protein
MYQLKTATTTTTTTTTIAPLQQKYNISAQFFMLVVSVKEMLCG